MRPEVFCALHRFASQPDLFRLYILATCLSIDLISSNSLVSIESGDPIRGIFQSA